MDDAFTSEVAPALVHANLYTFRAGERIQNDPVASVCLLIALSGRGVVESASTEIEMTPYTVVWLPWMHDVRYWAHRSRPFRVATVHLVPAHATDVPIEPRVAFGDDDPLLDVPYRGGVSGEPLVLDEPASEVSRLRSLAEYAIDRWTRGMTTDASLRHLGALLMEEYARSSARGPAGQPNEPPTLLLMQRFVEESLRHRLTVADVAAHGRCSTSTAERLFLRWTGSTVMAWVAKRRMERAAELLSSTGLRVGEVAREAGYPDQFYFSRVFTRHFGVSPSRYASGRIRP